MKKLKALMIAALFLIAGNTFAQTAQPAAKQDAKAKATPAEVKTKKDGTPDKRYAENQKLKKDGTPDKRYSENKHLKKDGTPDKRFKAKSADTLKTAKPKKG
jgi:hypothetical protein